MPTTEIGEAQSIDLRDTTGRTDRANGQRFALNWGNGIRWCDQWATWLVYADGRWQIDHQRRVEAMAKKQSDAIWREAVKLIERDSDLTEELVKFAKYTANARGIEAMLKMARSEPGIPALPEQFDSHPYLFNCKNGVVDLESGELQPHNADLMLTKICPVAFLDPVDAKCPLWLKTVDTILAHDPETVAFVRRLFGSALVGEVVDHVLPIFFGTGANGKSVVIETMLEVFGEFGGKAPPDLLLAKRGEVHPCEKADLFGKRLVCVVETDQDRRLSESTAKELTGGDRISARRMRENFWSFKPSHTIVMATNHQPRVKGNDHAIWRRLRLVPFNQKFWDATRGEDGPAELKADPWLKQKLAAEYPGILRWLVEACMEWQHLGLGEPAAIRTATSQYRDAEDTLAEWFDASIAPADDGKVRASELRSAYQEWCKANNEKPCGNRRLGEYMSLRGIERSISNGVVYHGIVLLEGWKD
jgi:putative DNA primase/helicase